MSAVEVVARAATVPFSPVTSLPAELVYSVRGALAHLTHTGNDTITWCGLRRPEGWLGTGSQVEYETAAMRPVCEHCTAQGPS